MKDLFHNLKFVALVDPVVATASLTAKTVTLDGSFDSGVFEFAVGASGDTLSETVKIELQVEASTDGTNFSAVSSSDVFGLTPDSSGIVAVIDGAADDSTVYRFGYAGGAAKLKFTVVLTGTHTNGTPVALLGMFGNKRFSSDTTAPTVA